MVPESMCAIIRIERVGGAYAASTFKTDEEIPSPAFRG